jgi:glutaryl-CoA dehydrogenase
MKKFDGFDYVLVDERLSDDEKMVRDSVRSFIEEEAMPKFMEHYEKGTFPKELIQPLAELGVFGANIQGYECAGLNNVAYGLMMQELERGDSGLRSFASVQSGLVMYPIYAFGDEEQKSKWLPELAKGKVIGCFGLTEADFGSNPSGMLTTARLDGNEYVLNGSKMWITNGVTSGVSIVWAKLDGEVNGFIVERDRKGFDAKSVKYKLSMRASDTAELVLDGVRIPKANRLPKADSLKAALMCLTQARYGIAWGVLGAAMACIHEALEYSKARIMFDKPIAGYQLTQKKLADMATELTLAQLLCLQLGRLKDENRLRPAHVSMAKRNNVRKALEIARTARTILGANGISGEYQSMRHMCNLETVDTYEGTYEIHTLVIGDELTGIPAYQG